MNINGRLITLMLGSATILFSAERVGAQVPIPSEFDTGLDSIAVAFKSSKTMTMGYLSQPKAAGMRPGAVVPVAKQI